MKKILFCVCIFVTICLAGFLWFVSSLFNTHQHIISNEPEALQTVVENDELYLKVYSTEVEIDKKESITEIGFEVFDKCNNESIFNSGPVCRRYDFKEIKFDNDSNDIIVKSGDVGPIYFQRISYSSWKKLENN